MEAAAAPTEATEQAAPTKRRVKWYRCYVSREDLAYLNKRSDFLGFLQTLGYLGILATTGTLPILLVGWVISGTLRWYAGVPAALAILYFHGMCWQFLINGFHELIHDSVFKTKWLNPFFLRIFSFLGWYNHHGFWASHTEHHKYTLHPPDDQEVVLPVKFDFNGQFWRAVIFNPLAARWFIMGNVRIASGKLAGGWETKLFTELYPERRHLFTRWSRILLIGHGLILVGSVLAGWLLKMPQLFMIPLVVSLPLSWGSWLHFFCNSSQHVGLKDNAPDFRLCCRTIYLNPFVQFLYWHMNYHTEHHMFAAVPCYKLGKLHRAIKAEMPWCPSGLRETWKHIGEVLDKQKVDPSYQYAPELPPRPVRPKREEPTLTDTDTGQAPQAAA